MRSWLERVKLLSILLPLGMVYLFYLAIWRPYTFNSQNLAIVLGIFVLGFAAAGFENYFPLIVLAIFMWAGTTLPMAGAMQMMRWVVLGVGAFLSLAYYALRSTRIQFSVIHLVAFFVVITAYVSALGSYNPLLTVLKATSFAALATYSLIGVRIVWRESPNRIVMFLLRLARGLVVVSGVSEFLFGAGIWGNPNSLGLIMGVICWPILLWHYLLVTDFNQRVRRGFFVALCAALLLASGARSALLAVAVVSLLILVASRQYRTLIRGFAILLMLLTSVYIIAPHRFQRTSDQMIYKKGDRYRGVLFSRQSTWEKSIQSFQNHPWLGSGFGVSEVSVMWRGGFESSMDTRERGSSYLTILEGVGLVGGVPVALLLLLLLSACYRTFSRLRRGGDLSHPVVPVAALLIAGCISAGFEDWLMAAGYYGSVIFWLMAFSLPDLLASYDQLSPASSSTLVNAAELRYA